MESRVLEISQPEPLVVGVKEAGRLLAIKQTSVYGLLHSGELAFIKIGRSTRIELAALREYLDHQRVGHRPSTSR
jgi:excisionase family DNA binding protein